MPTNDCCFDCNFGYPTEHVGGLALFIIKYMYIFSRNLWHHLSPSKACAKAAHTEVSSLQKSMCMLQLL